MFRNDWELDLMLAQGHPLAEVYLMFWVDSLWTDLGGEG